MTGFMTVNNYKGYFAKVNPYLNMNFIGGEANYHGMRYSEMLIRKRALSLTYVNSHWCYGHACSEFQIIE